MFNIFLRREHNSTQYLLCLLRKEGIHKADSANSSSSIEDIDGNGPANARNSNTTHSFYCAEENESSKIASNRYIQEEQIFQSDSSLEGNTSSSSSISNFLF